MNEKRSKTIARIRDSESQNLIQSKSCLLGKSYNRPRSKHQIMSYDDKKIAGFLIFVGVAELILAVVISEAIYSGYNVGRQPMSDLGNWSLAGNSAAIYDVSVLLLGISAIVSAYYIQRTFKNRLFTSLLVITGVSSIGVGIVAEDVYLPLHGVFALIVFVLGAVTAIMSYKFEKSPLSHISVILGLVVLFASVLFILGRRSSGFYLGLGEGGIERLIIYPLWLWRLGFGAHLIGDSGKSATASEA
jgi:hypothetical membrane protein